MHVASLQPRAAPGSQQSCEGASPHSQASVQTLAPRATQEASHSSEQHKLSYAQTQSSQEIVEGVTMTFAIGIDEWRLHLYAWSPATV